MSYDRKKNKILAAVVTYNRKALLKECIESLLKQSYKYFDILVVDNASTDCTEEELKPMVEAGTILYHNNGENLGGAGGFNKAMRIAVEKGYDYVWVMDDDTIPTAKTLEELMKKDTEAGDRYGFLSSKVIWKDDSICKMNVQKKNKWKRLRKFEKEEKIQYASFVSFFLRTETIKNVGLPYKEFFVWADDWEYSRRISKRKECYYVPSSIVHHWCDENIGAEISSSKPERIDRFKTMYRNDVVLYRLDGVEGILYLGIRNILHIFRIIMLSEKKKEKIKIIYEGTKSGINFHPKIEYI